MEVLATGGQLTGRGRRAGAGEAVGGRERIGVVACADVDVDADTGSAATKAGPIVVADMASGGPARW